ncbi:MAG: HAMP domain-containing histidine kinase [Myxococcales bacterium FL481]|nr:MAG: HAMP domain-containing histidine kinase [Myxococcales bacterium FL481]
MATTEDSSAVAADPPTQPELRHVRDLQRGMFALAAGCSWLALVLELRFPSVASHRAPLLLLYLALLTAASTLAWCRHRDGDASRWAVVVAVFALASAAIALDHNRPATALAGIFGTLLWSGLLVRARVNAMLAASVLPLLWAHGTTIADGTLRDVHGNPLALSVLPVYLALPVVAGAGIQRASSVLSAALLRRLEQAHVRREELLTRLREHDDALQASRAELLRARKLEVVGTMASGLAHELNNILTPVRGLGELLASGLVSQEQAQHYGQRILRSAVAAGRITSSLLTYTWQGPFQPVRTNAREFLELELLPELVKGLPHGVQLDAKLGDDIWIDVDRMQFEHCVTNLVLNAADAMPNGGPIFIQLDTWSECDDADAPPTHAELTVRDRGTGIAPEHLDHIFEPFFTTKAIGAGTGLGLALVQGSVTRHGGMVAVKSHQGVGTSFVLRLPLAAQTGVDVGKPRGTDDWDATGPTVLVVMEDADDLDELEELLVAHHCAPLRCHEPRRALQLVADMASRIQVAVLDLETASVDMRHTYRQLRQAFPRLPVILLSREPTSPKNRQLIGDHPTRCVRKPVDPNALSALLQGFVTGRDETRPCDGSR